MRTSDINNLEINSDPSNGISEENYDKYQEIQIIEKYDILFVPDGTYRIGKSAHPALYNTSKVLEIADHSFFTAMQQKLTVLVSLESCDCKKRTLP